jgi:Heterokaryon incompatibility protein (HET)
MFVTTVANRPELEIVSGLSQYLNQVPLVIRDAMALIKSIGERYLWVDALCIEQDNPGQKHNQIAQMDIVYGHAFLTIVALCATDAGNSHPGVRPGTRESKEISQVIRGVRWVAQKDHFAVTFQDAIYETRGWTMQERLFSTRCLYLTKLAAYWHCCQTVVLSDNDPSSRYELCLALQTNGNFSYFLQFFSQRHPCHSSHARALLWRLRICIRIARRHNAGLSCGPLSKNGTSWSTEVTASPFKPAGTCCHFRPLARKQAVLYLLPMVPRWLCWICRARGAECFTPRRSPPYFLNR